MTKGRTQAVKLGIFMVTVVAIVVLALVLVGGLRLGRPAATYHVITGGGVVGIDVDSAVTLRGVEVGRVAAIELDRSDFGRVEIDLEIDRDVAIPASSRAYFQRVGVTGQRAIDITGGTLADGRLPPGGVIPRGETALDVLESRARELGDELTTLVADARETVGQAKRMMAAVDPEHLGALVAAVDPGRVQALVGHAEQAARTLASTSKQLERAVSEGRGQLDAVAARASTVLEHADSASQELSRLLAAAAFILDANEDDVRAAIGDLRRASQDARALVRALRTRPSLLLRSAPPEERRLP